MMQYGFKDYEGFKELFVREDGKRKNGVLLSFFKNKNIKKFARDQKQLRRFLNIKSMGELVTLCDAFVRSTGIGEHSLWMLGNQYRSDKYQSDRFDGVCEDGDFGSYRYQNMERDGKLFKMKIGKMYKHLIQSSEFGKLLNEQVILFLCEEMTRKWMAENSAKYPKYELHVDDNFEKIYSSRWLVGSFGSCMTDNNQWSFYRDAVKAKAAYLTNSDGLIVARCIIFTDVYDEDGNKYRLAERQYSSNGDEVLKLMLVYALIKNGHIDGYKKVGADCHSPRSWMTVTDEPFKDPRFHIECNLDYDDTLSYQDSFKTYDMECNTAYNWDKCCGSYYDLATTDSAIDGDNRNYDEYHEEYTNSDTIEVCYHGRWMTCSEDWMDDFRWVESSNEYHHEDDVFYCEECNEYELNDRGCYSDLTEEYYCCECCRDSAEQTWKEANWEYSVYDNDYVEEVVEYYRLADNDYIPATISTESVESAIRTGYLVERDGEYYENSDILDEWIEKNM